MQIGFVGLGVMGAPMAGHLAKAGHASNLLDVDVQRTRTVAGLLGARVAATPAELAAASELVITMLSDGQVVQQVAFGAGGLVEGPGPCCWTPRRPSPG